MCQSSGRSIRFEALHLAALLNLQNSLLPGQYEQSMAEPQANLDFSVNAPSPADPFVGRERELAQVFSALDLAGRGQGGVVTLSGEPGIGKTRMAQAFAQSASHCGVYTLWGRCSEDPGAPPYWPWVEILRAHVQSRNEDLLRAELADSASYVAEMAPEIVHRVGRVASTPRPPDAAQARFIQFDALTSFWKRVAATETLLFILDDVHCADTPSLKLLEFLAKEIGSSRLLVLATYRTYDVSQNQPLTDVLAELGRHARLQRIALSGMSAHESEELARTVLGSALSPQLAAKIHERTEGNPLFINEMTRYLQEGARTGGGHDSIATRWDQLASAVPEGIQQIIGARLNKLTADCADVLGVAAVMGRSFSLDVVSLAMPERPREQSLAALDMAVAARIVETATPSPWFRFTHALLCEVLYERTPITRRSGLHERIARAIQVRYAYELTPHLSALSHHYCSSLPDGPADIAVEMALRAGKCAQELLAFEEAAAHYQLALEASFHDQTVSTSRRADLYVKLGKALSHSGDSMRALESLQHAFVAAKQANEPELQARAAIDFEEASWRFAMLSSAALAPLTEALAALGPQDTALKAAALSSLARCLMFVGASEEAYRTAELANSMARRLNDDAALVVTLTRSLAAYDLRPEDFSQRCANTEEGIKLARQTGNREFLLYLVGWHVYNLSESGDMVARSQFLEELGRLAEEQRQPLYQYVFRRFHALTAMFEGRFAEAERIAVHASKYGLNFPELNSADVHAVQMLSVRREQGRLAEVAPVLEHFERDAPPGSQWRPGLMIVYSELGQHDKARVLYESFARENFASVVRDARWVMTISYLSEMCCALGDAAAAAHLYRALLPYEGRNLIVGHKITTYGPAGRYLGMLAATMQQWKQAEHHFTAAIAMNIRQGSKPWLAHTQYHYAAMLNARNAPGDRSRAIELLDQALDIASALNMLTLADRTSSLRDAIKPSRARVEYPAGLSRREVQVLKLVAQGKANHEIAEQLFISKNTVAKQVRSILAKTNCNNRTEAAAFALRNISLFPHATAP